MLPPAGALLPNSSLLASLFVGSGLCFLRLTGNNSAGGSSSPSVASSFSRRIQSFHTSTERSKLFKLSRCLLSADGSLSLFAHRSTLHISSLLVVSPLMLSLYNSAEFLASQKYSRTQLALERECSFAWLLLLPTSAPMLFDRDPIPLNPYLGLTLRFFQSSLVFCNPTGLMDLVAAAQLSFPVVCTDASLLSNCSAPELNGRAAYLPPRHSFCKACDSTPNAAHCVACWVLFVFLP